MSHPRRLLPIALIAGLPSVMILAGGVGHAAPPLAVPTVPSVSTVPTVPAAAATLLLIDAGRLDDVQARLKRGGDEALAGALAALERDAAKVLAMTPVSVMDKAITPPSGDKHDYMSQAPYWWPDPSKANGLPYIRKDGERNPEINRLSDHDNLGRLNGAVLTLGLAYRLTGREEYAAHAAKLTRVWFLDPATRMNPHLKFGQGIPGITEGRGIGIIETRGLPDLLDGITLIGGSAAWTDSDQKGLADWMRAFLAWLVDSTHGQEEAKNGNNHETWYDVQVASLALFTGQSEVAKRTLERSRDRIAKQFEPDGRQPRELERTRAWDYSIFNLTAFFNLARLGSRVGVDLWGHKTADGRSLRQAFDYLVPVAAGDRKWTYEQISEFSPKPLVPLLRRAAVAWSEPKYAALAKQIGSDSPRLDLLVP
jgi:hypothetical protein